MKRIISLALVLLITISSLQVCFATSGYYPYSQPVYYGGVPVQPQTPIYITVNGDKSPNNSKGSNSSISPAVLLAIIAAGILLYYNYREPIEKYVGDLAGKAKLGMETLMTTYCVKKIAEAVGYVGMAFSYITPLLNTLGAAGMTFLSFIVKHFSPGIKTA